jgi:lipoteichoic acid synthase
MNASSEPNVPSLWAAWSRANLAWVFGLCLPLLALSLHFKLLRIAQRRIQPDVHKLFELLLSDLSTVLFWGAASLGLVAFAERRSHGLSVRVALQVCALLYAAVLLGAHGYFMSTGSGLDYPMLSFALTHLAETAKVIGSARSPGRIAAFSAAVIGILVLPWWFASFVGKRPVARVSDRWLALLHAWTLAGLCLAVALAARSEFGLDLARDPLLNLALTMGSKRSREDAALLLRASKRPTGAKLLEETAQTRRKNVVIILLESTGQWATSLGRHPTTPFLLELALKSQIVDQAYAVEPHTSKALVTTLCGTEPRPGIGIAESLPAGLLGKCLPDLLRPSGYHSAMFQAATRSFEEREQLVRNLGFDEFVSGDRLPHEGMQKANYFGWEDRVILPAIQSFLERMSKSRSTPFLMTLLTNQPHHDYLPVTYYGSEEFVEEPIKNQYLNAVHYDDFVLRDVFEKFKAAGLLQDTIFVVLGDHGEGFGEHGRYSHDDTIYEEGLQIPLLIYDPSGKRAPAHIAGRHDELDVVPTVLDLLGLRVAEGSFVGASLFANAPERPINIACYNENKCLARIQGSLKYIHHFDRQHDELFDLESDPNERKNILRKHKAEGALMLRDVVDWYNLTRAMYRPITERVANLYVTRKPPEVDHPSKIRFGDAVEYLGYSYDGTPIKRGGSFTITYHFHVLSRLPPGYRLFVHALDGERSVVWDHVPVEHMFPEDEWRPGQYVSDAHHIKMPRDWATQTMRIRIGFDKPHDKRLITSPPAPDDSPVLAELPVQE